MRLASIERVTEGSYRVRLESMAGVALGEFLFDVLDYEFELVKWSEEFAAFMSTTEHHWNVRPLFESIFAFHRARELERPHPHPTTT